MKIAKRPIELPPWETFVERAENVIAAKVEIDAELESRENAASAIKSQGDFVVENLDVEELANKYAGKVDYIFTDPPYGGHISYLDLSMLWNCWLGDLPSPEIRQKEIIVGGDLNLTEDLYIARLGKSIECSLRMLKEHAWLSVVFQHWDIRYFAAILNSAAGAGGKLAAAVSQIGDPIWSMHKKKGSDSVLAGEVIITFQKRSNQPEISTPKTHFDLESEVVRLLADAKGDRVYGETIFNELVMGAWRAKRLDELSIDKFALSQLIASKGYAYDATSHAWVTSQPEPAKLF